MPALGIGRGSFFVTFWAKGYVFEMTAESATRPLRGASVAALAHNMSMKCLV